MVRLKALCSLTFAWVTEWREIQRQKKMPWDECHSVVNVRLSLWVQGSRGANRCGSSWAFTSEEIYFWGFCHGRDPQMCQSTAEVSAACFRTPAMRLWAQTWREYWQTQLHSSQTDIMSAVSSDTHSLVVLAQQREVVQRQMAPFGIQEWTCCIKPSELFSNESNRWRVALSERGSADRVWVEGRTHVRPSPGRPEFTSCLIPSDASHFLTLSR